MRRPSGDSAWNSAGVSRSRMALTAVAGSLMGGQYMSGMKRRPRLLSTLVSTLAVGLLALGRLDGADMPEPITYTLRFPAPQTHYVEVEALFPTGGQPALDLRMAVWTPGSYLVREFS